LSSYDGASVPDDINAPKKLTLPDTSLLHARILYCTSPALGHNKVSNFQALFYISLVFSHASNELLIILNY
jgi:hypothetical protein